MGFILGYMVGKATAPKPTPQPVRTPTVEVRTAQDVAVPVERVRDDEYRMKTRDGSYIRIILRR